VLVVEPDPDRRALAGSTSADPASAVTAVRALTDGRGADVVVECAGAPAVSLCRVGGTVVLVGVSPEPATFPTMDVVLGEKRVVGSVSHRWDTDLTAAVALLHSGHVRVDHLPTRTVALAEVATVLAAPPGNVVKTIVAV